MNLRGVRVLGEDEPLSIFEIIMLGMIALYLSIFKVFDEFCDVFREDKLYS